jgi:hypothetical protein
MILDINPEDNDEVKKKLNFNKVEEDYEKITDIQLEFDYNLPPNIDKIILNKKENN